MNISPYTGTADPTLAPGPLTLLNTIIANNSNDTGQSNCSAYGGDLVSLGHNIASDNTCNLTATGYGRTRTRCWDSSAITAALLTPTPYCTAALRSAPAETARQPTSEGCHDPRRPAMSACSKPNGTAADRVAARGAPIESGAMISTLRH